MSLNKQSRMRPEFSVMLREIYPDYLDNLQIVCENTPLKCLKKSMFFWSHSFPEGNPDKKHEVPIIYLPTWPT